MEFGVSQIWQWRTHNGTGIVALLSLVISFTGIMFTYKGHVAAHRPYVWRWGESNPRPQAIDRSHYMSVRQINFRSKTSLLARLF